MGADGAERNEGQAFVSRLVAPGSTSRRWVVFAAVPGLGCAVFMLLPSGVVGAVGAILHTAPSSLPPALCWRRALSASAGGATTPERAGTTSRRRL